MNGSTLNLGGMVHVDYEDGRTDYVNRVGHSIVLLIIYEFLYWTNVGAHWIKLVMWVPSLHFGYIICPKLFSDGFHELLKESQEEVRGIFNWLLMKSLW